MSVRTRIAPSPTGEFHIGTLRTLLYDYALSRQSNGQVIIRIEDTDQARLVEGATDRLLDAITNYGLNWDEGPRVKGPYGPYIQSQRLDIYQKYVQLLIEQGDAYYCFCSTARLDSLREEQRASGSPTTKYDRHCLNLSKEEIQKKLDAGEKHVVRMKIPDNQEIEFDDLVVGKVSFPTKDIDDQVLLKSDGFPTYHLAVVIDDYLMKITHVLRGVEWLPSTPKHVLLYRAFGWDIPMYAHLPLLKEAGENAKLSKRKGAVSAAGFLQEGYIPEAVLNFLMLTGWNPGTEKEIYSLDEFVKDFSIERVHKTDLIVFDRQKLLWFNGYYIRSFSAEELYDRLKKWHLTYMPDAKFLLSKDDSYNLSVVKFVQERLKFFSEYDMLTSYFYVLPEVDMVTLVGFSGSKEKAHKILEDFIEMYDACNNWKLDELDKISHDLLAQKGYKPKEAFMTLRVAITGQTTTPPIFDIISLIGKEQTIIRLKNVINSL